MDHIHSNTADVCVCVCVGMSSWLQCLLGCDGRGAFDSSVSTCLEKSDMSWCLEGLMRIWEGCAWSCHIYATPCVCWAKQPAQSLPTSQRGRVMSCLLQMRPAHVNATIRPSMVTQEKNFARHAVKRRPMTSHHPRHCARESKVSKMSMDNSGRGKETSTTKRSRRFHRYCLAMDRVLDHVRDAELQKPVMLLIRFLRMFMISHDVISLHTHAPKRSLLYKIARNVFRP